jgi:hypothetical protein
MQKSNGTELLGGPTSPMVAITTTTSSISTSHLERNTQMRSQSASCRLNNTSQMGKVSSQTKKRSGSLLSSPI